MSQVEVEILTQTITSQYGVLSAGDILRTSPEFAAHLVNEAFAAKYTKAKAQPSPTPAEVMTITGDASPDGRPEPTGVVIEDKPAAKTAAKAK